MGLKIEKRIKINEVRLEGVRPTSAKVHIKLRDREFMLCHKSIARQVIDDNNFHLTFTTRVSLLRSKNSRVMIVKSPLWN